MELESLISKSLQSHRLYCEIRKRIPNIHQEIYHQVYQIILQEASNVCDENELQKLFIKLPLDNLLKQQTYQQIDILAINAKTISQSLNIQQLYPPETKKYLSACQQLFYATRISGRMKRPYINYRTSKFYQDIIHEYEMQIWRFICEQIRKFEYDKSQNISYENLSRFMTWLNGCSNNLFKKALDKYNKISPELLLIEDNLNENNDYINTLASSEEIPLSAKIINLIEQDEMGVFRSEHIKNKPQANFREIVLLLRDGNKMKDIADNFDVPLQSLYTLQKRCIDKYRNYIKKNI
ncbi:MAG: hypothetical protein HC836_43705 [Richelia sp. RM2_1_2]|nr:hypothetical protein [Richelia sp. SM1_7_0]NJN13087.1 hypothetical protein [Richelia sp. RM1_1_1]NJO64798.1 hypothetical protein [Richelia sp. RM2_1_2]